MIMEHFYKKLLQSNFGVVDIIKVDNDNVLHYRDIRTGEYLKIDIPDVGLDWDDGPLISLDTALNRLTLYGSKSTRIRISFNHPILIIEELKSTYDRFMKSSITIVNRTTYTIEE